ncbi:hypothetical protein HHK36_027970 [Tetracentron sinense]|uniref:Uncharacterized protein n=1 Tax=Tetracentron sinense TaxID=13715 RepID=A0A834YE21_TETSI|nr:hypothetical protein HHK36_027970 [Tetracentron sinense]
MATDWVRSLQCKSRALEDVYNPEPKNLAHLSHLLPSSSCRNSVQSLKDVVETTKKKPRKSIPPLPKQPSSRYSRPTKTDLGSNPINRVRPNISARPPRKPDPFFPTLSELPQGHPSRNVVEIIFHSSWSPEAFSGRIEMLFKVQNLPKTIARFEDYRETVKSRASSCSSGNRSRSRDDDARCIADGNEVMKFHCLGPISGGIYDAGGMCMFSGKDRVICTFDGSGRAQESAGGGKGRRGMLVCRVVAGRVGKQFGFDSLMDGRVGFDSVSGEDGELLVFDSRALLPCFLIIYKL